jgi:hypothetical protein
MGAMAQPFSAIGRHTGNQTGKTGGTMGSSTTLGGLSTNTNPMIYHSNKRKIGDT